MRLVFNMTHDTSTLFLLPLNVNLSKITYSQGKKRIPLFFISQSQDFLSVQSLGTHPINPAQLETPGILYTAFLYSPPRASGNAFFTS